MRYCLFAWLMLGGVGIACAQEAGSLPGPVVPAQTAGGQDPAEARYAGLLKTAAELEAAGRPLEARRVRGEAEELREALLARIDRLQAELDRLRQLTGAVPQVVVQVRMMEVSRTKLRALGFDLTKIEGEPVPGAQTMGNSGAGRFRIVDDSRQLMAVFEALRKDNLVKVLCEPTLVTFNGRPVHFRSGSEVPVPVPGKDGTTAIEYRLAGNQVDLVPTILGDQRVRLAIRIQLSEIDPGRTVKVGEQTVPGLRVRDLDTGAELRSGQTLVLSGLTQTHVEASRRGVPWLGDLPYVGAPFRSVQEQINEIEMLVLLTPEIARPFGQ